MTEAVLHAAGPSLVSPSRGRRRLIAVGAGSGWVVVLVLATSVTSTDRLGAPAYWPWVLTGLQVCALWAAGSHRWWGWPLGAAVQPPWIAYAVVTGQLGFIPGCLVSAVVQSVTSWRDAAPDTTPDERRESS